MNLNFWLIQTFNGISYGALLFLVGSGLSLIFGVMRIVNLSHGSYFLLGGYVALTVIWTTGSWLLAIPVAAVTIALVGLAMERVFLRPLGFDPLRQVLLTVGFAFLFQQAALDIWTGNNFDITPARGAVAEHPDRRNLSAALPRLHDRDRAPRSAWCSGSRWRRPGWAPRCAPPSTTRRWRAASASTPRASRC